MMIILMYGNPPNHSKRGIVLIVANKDEPVKLSHARVNTSYF